MNTNVWKKCLAVGIILLFIGTAIIPSNAQDNEKSLSPASRGNWLYVGGSGPGNYSKIQDALDNASDGDTVFVYHDNSPYYGNVSINHAIHLIGENRNTTIIEGRIVQINANNVTLSNFTVQNSGSHPDYAGIVVEGNYVVIVNNNILHNCNGIEVNSDLGHNIISYNNVSYNRAAGISIDGDLFDNIPTTENVVQGNTVSHNGACGISTSYAVDKTKIINNKIFDNGGGIFSEDSYDEICYNEIISNNIGGIRYGNGLSAVNVSICNNTIEKNLGFGIWLDGQYPSPECHVNFTVCHNNIESNRGAGIRVCWTKTSRISENNVYHNLINACIKNSFGNTWDGNYWGTPQRVKLIAGVFWPFDWAYPRFGLMLLVFPMFNVDWHPAQQPYNIPGMS
jgi:parallel beta-helix repeat protein